MIKERDADPLSRLSHFCFALVAVLTGCSHAASNGEATSSPSTAPLPVATGDYPAYGHAPDFSWMSGSIGRSLKGGGCTYLQFSPRPGAPWGGRIALTSPKAQLGAYNSGDMIVVRGSLSSLSDGACGNIAYDVQAIEEH
ncbi:MAG: hypothetical protein M3007_06215 [Candidatus Eremiobacteraeota bacterium]|nr:hypothetical protein [Candidatus Eremiobacteraeota bacterium]